MAEKYRVALETSDYKIWHEEYIQYAKRIDRASRSFVLFIVNGRWQPYDGVVTFRKYGEIIYQHRFNRSIGDMDFWSVDDLKREFSKYLDDDFWNDDELLGYGKQTAGRPRLLEGGKRVNVYLDTESLERAERLGLGNVSEGIRIALRQARV
jgi:hypothetical protein